MLRTIAVSWVGWTSYKDYFRAVLHDAAYERCAALHAASGERCAAPRDAACDQRVALGAVSYRTLLERLVLERLVLERLVLEWLVLERLVLERLAVPEPQPLTWSAGWSAGPRRPLVPEE
jgi:hypothetical protein